MMIQDPLVFRTAAIIKKGLFPLIFDMVLFKEEQGNRKENSCSTYCGRCVNKPRTAEIIM